MPYVRARVYGTIGLIDRPVLRGQRFLVLPNAADDPPDRLLQSLLQLGLVELDPDQEPDPVPIALKPSLWRRLRNAIHDWRARRAVGRIPLTVTASPALLTSASAQPRLWLPTTRPAPSLAVIECTQCADAASCPHLATAR